MNFINFKQKIIQKQKKSQKEHEKVNSVLGIINLNGNYVNELEYR